MQKWILVCSPWLLFSQWKTRKLITCCKIWGLHGGDHEEWCLLGFYAVWLLVFLRSVRRLLVAACVVPSSLIFVTVMKVAPGSSETLVLTRATRRNNPEDTIPNNLLLVVQDALRVRMRTLAPSASRSVVVKALCYKPEGCGFETRCGEWFLSIYLNLSVALGPGIYSASNRNEYKKHKNMFLGSKAAAGA
jgi:hypothetical protein